MCHPRATAAVIVTEVELPGIVRGGIIRGPGGRHRVAELREGAAAGRRREADLGENGASAAAAVASRGGMRSQGRETTGGGWRIWVVGEHWRRGLQTAM
jgi:hypothetical protein